MELSKVDTAASPSLAKPVRFIVSIVDNANRFNPTFLTTSHNDHSDTSVAVFDRILNLPGLEGYFVNALRGLLCLRLGKRFRICNLTTDQRVTLPIISSQLLVEPNDDEIWTTFGYDHVHNEYKVLNIVYFMSEEDYKVRSEHQVLVLGPQASWRNTKGHTFPHYPCTQGILIKSVLYYGVLLDHNQCAVMSFNFTSEDFKLIKLPIEASTIWHSNCSSIMNFKNQIAVIEYSNLASIHLWTMEYGMNWSKRTLILPLSDMIFEEGDQLEMKGTDRCGEVMLGKREYNKVEPIPYVFFDLEKNKTTRSLQINLPYHWFFNVRDGFETSFWDDGIENTMFLET